MNLQPVTLEDRGVRLEPLTTEHHDDLIAVASDGKLWELWYTNVPHPDQMRTYLEATSVDQEAGRRLPWVVRELESGRVVGTTSYHDIVMPIGRVEIGHTWYASSWHRTHINTTCKLLLLRHAFETLECKVVGLRTDGFNFRSQRAIEALGAKKDGVLRHHKIRQDGTVRDTVMYSILFGEWPDVKRNLEFRLARHSRSARSPTPN
jgi:RimJ/RimL family protein N-acetyltransferase